MGEGVSRVNYICRLPHCLKSNVTELRSHKVSWQIQPRNWRQASHRRRQEPPQLIDEPDLGDLSFRVLRLIDTLVGSPNCHYVNRSVRGFRPPGSRRISSARFGPSRLRMRCIIRPRVVVPAIPSAPVAAHSIAFMLYEVSRPSGTFLIPDCAPAEHP